MLPSFTDIRYFIEVSQTGNISRAAERLGISQPSLSLAMRRVEDSIGCALFVRTKSGVQLNHTGKKFSVEARNILTQWEQIRAQAINTQEGIVGQYSIGCHPSVALYSLPYFMSNLLKENPNLEISLKHDLSRKITEEVISFQLDFGIAVNPVQHPDLVIKKLATDKVTLWTKKNPTDNQRTEKKNAVLICEPNLAQTQSILKKLEKNKINFSRIVNSTNLEVITSLVANGVGVGILPTRVAENNPEQKLKVLSTKSPFFSDDICLVYRADAQKSQAAKLIIKSIVGVF